MKIFLTVVCVILLMHPLNAQQSFQEKVQQYIEEEHSSLENLYKHLHAHPELSFEEEKTSKRLADALRQTGFIVTENVGGYGVVAVLKNGEGPTVLVRTDMDALPIREETGVDFASSVTTKDESGREVPVMHACGHDLHMAVWTGTARIFARLKDRWKGTLVFIAQPAEERGSGAKAMLADGLFTKFPRPDFGLALHVNASLSAGKVGYCPGYALASTDMIDVTVKGKGGHGALPHLTIDPVVMSSRIVLDLQTIISREISPLTPAVLTVGAVHGGSKGNIIPGEVEMALTLRSFEQTVRDQIIEKVRRITSGIAMSAGLAEEDYPVVKVREDEHIPSLYNDPVLADRISGVFRQVLGEENVELLPPEMVSEDFSRYGREEPTIPTLMFSLGTVAKTKMEAAQNGVGEIPSVHSSRYLPDMTNSLKTGVLSMSVAIQELLKNP